MLADLLTDYWVLWVIAYLLGTLSLIVFAIKRARMLGKSANEIAGILTHCSNWTPNVIRFTDASG